MQGGRTLPCAFSTAGAKHVVKARGDLHDRDARNTFSFSSDSIVLLRSAPADIALPPLIFTSVTIV